MDRSLKLKGALTRHRNILSRAERIKRLQDEEKWIEGDSVFGLPKVAHRKSHAGHKAAVAKEAVPGAEGTVGVAATAAGAEAPAARAPGAKAEKGAKPAAKPEKGAKPAAKPEKGAKGRKES